MYLYVIGCGDIRKVGIALDPEKRLRGIRTGNPHVVTLEHVEPCPKPIVRRAEAIAHRMLSGFWTAGEWFAVGLGEAQDAVTKAVRLAADPTFDARRAGDATPAKDRAAALRKARGERKTCGPPRKITTDQAKLAAPDWNDNSVSTSTIAARLGVCRRTLYSRLGPRGIQQASLAQMERELGVERTLAGLAAARERGRVGGRTVVLTDEVKAKARELMLGGMPTEKAAKAVGVSRTALFRAKTEIMKGSDDAE